MNKNEVINYFGTIKQTAAFLNIDYAAVFQWPDLIPEVHSMRLERLTDGALKHPQAVYDEIRERKSQARKVVVKGKAGACPACGQS